MAVTMNARWDNSGTVIPGGDAEYVVAEQPIAEYDNWFNYNIVADIQAVIDDVINKFNANTILKADTDNTPAALVVAEQTIVGRKTGNSIAALTSTEVRTILNVEDGSTADQSNTEIRDAVEAAADSNTFTDSDRAIVNDAMVEAVFDANTVVKADSDNTPVALTVAEQTLVGRITAGVITALTATQVRTLINVADGADVTGSNAPQFHASSHEIGGADEVEVSAYALTNDIMHSNDAEVNAPDNYTWTKMKEILVTTSPGTIRVQYKANTSANHATIGSRIYKNGVAFGTMHTSVPSGYTTYSEDLAFDDGDLLQLYLTCATGVSCSAKELRILGDMVPVNDALVVSNQ